MRKLALIIAAILALGTAHGQSASPSPIGPTSLQVRPPGSGGPTIDDVVTYGSARTAFNPSMLSLMGDSRIAYTTVGGGYTLTSQSWFNAANARAGHRYILGTNAGGSGCTSDLFLSAINLNAVKADPSAWVVINSPAVNNFGGIKASPPATVGGNCTQTGSGFPYTDSNGNTITTTNVGQFVANDVITAAESIIAIGKRVILTDEPGSTVMSVSPNQLYDLTFRLKAYAASRPGQVYFWSYNAVVWAPTSSSTAIAFKAGYSPDGVHYAPIAADVQGQAFNTAFQSLFPVYDVAVSNVNFLNSTTGLSLVPNPLFTTLTGGTTSGCGTITGNVPAGWQLNCHNAATTATITSAADANGYGNDITIALTFASADTGVNFIGPMTNGWWSTADYVAAGADVAVTGTPAATCLYYALNMVTSGGNSQQYDMYPNSQTACPTTAYTYRFQTLALQPLAGSNSFANSGVQVIASGAGSITYTISRAWAAKQYKFVNGNLLGP